MQITTTVYDVASGGVVVASMTDRVEAEQLRQVHPGAQIRTRAETTNVAAAFAVFVNGVQVGGSHNDPGDAAKAAKKCGGMIRMVAA